MANVTLSPFIRSISGQVGEYMFRTSASGKVTLYRAPKRILKTVVSPNEQRARSIFTERVRLVNNLMRLNPNLTRKEAWQYVKQLPL
ncbi:MAG: hypothetical protein IJU36_01465 [Paludibacteraceae bacterium]|nr:hypothetical protein [Paludibacteraceae bacterium]